MPVIVGAGSSAFEASGSSIKIPTATANLSGINTAVGTAYYNITNDELRVYTGATNGWKVASEPPPPALGEEQNPASSAQALRDAGTTTDGVYYITTPDGGTQQVYCMFTSGSSEGGDYGWMLVGRFSADAKTNVRSILASQRSMIDVTQANTSRWSADFGTYTTTEVRVIGCSNTTDWMANRSTDWIYQVPSSQNLIRFLTNQTNYTNTGKTAYGTVTSGPKQGMYCDGARVVEEDGLTVVMFIIEYLTLPSLWRTIVDLDIFQHQDLICGIIMVWVMLNGMYLLLLTNLDKIFLHQHSLDGMITMDQRGMMLILVS